jgi:hypothetical protein
MGYGYRIICDYETIDLPIEVQSVRMGVNVSFDIISLKSEIFEFLGRRTLKAFLDYFLKEEIILFDEL